MDCRKITELLIPYQEGTLDAKQFDLVTKHLESCDSCQKELEETKVLMEKLQHIDQKEPAARLRAGFYEMLAEEKQNAIHALSMQLFTPKEWLERKGKTEETPLCQGGDGGQTSHSLPGTSTGNSSSASSTTSTKPSS